MEDIAAARATDPQTSVAAAAISSRRLSDLQRIVIAALAGAAPHGLTVPEIAVASDIPVISISPRIRPLVRAGVVKDSGITRIPPGHTRACIVWELSGVRP